MDQNETTTELPATVEHDRRNLLSKVGIGALATALLSTMGPVGALIASGGEAHAQTAGITDQDILNFALNLEYLEGQYYTIGATGQRLTSAQTTGTGTLGGVNGGAQVPFQTALYLEYAQKITLDENLHINFLRSQLGSAAVAQPLLDLAGGFQSAAVLSGAVPANQVFNPFANEVNFFLGELALTEVGVSAYVGAAALISNPAILTAASRILSAEAYHAGAIRTVLGQSYLAGTNPALAFQVQAIKNLQSLASNSATPSNPILDNGLINPSNNVVYIRSAGASSLAISRTTSQVLNVVYGGNLAGADAGGFFPSGLNGRIR